MTDGAPEDGSAEKKNAKGRAGRSRKNVVASTEPVSDKHDSLAVGNDIPPETNAASEPPSDAERTEAPPESGSAPAPKPQGNGSRPPALQLALQAVGILLAAYVLFWLLDKLFLYRTSAGYIDEIAQVYDLNKNLATALTIIGFVFLALVGRYAFSFTRSKRYAAWGLIVAALIGHSLVLWQGTKSQFFSRSGEAIKCYIVTRNAITYGERPGIDPATGLQCRLITPEIVERIKEYERGRRPAAILTANPTFFDPRTGAAVVWFGRNTQGSIDIFDLMGFHPQTGAELKPVDKDVIAQWQKQTTEAQAAQSRRIPQRIDPEKYGFFDPITGAARVWYWQSDEGNYEFFDSDGFHHRTGDRLNVVTPALINQLKRDAEEAKRKRTEMEQTRQREEREKAELQERERQQALLQQQQKDNEIRVQAERQQSSGTQCDQLAANPMDRRKSPNVPGVPYDVLKANVAEAIRACDLAIRAFPSESRYQYQLARATQVNSPQEALGMFQRLVSAQYPAAYDNLGWLQVRLYRNYAEAARLFRLGVQQNDVDSIVSLAEMVERNYYQPQSASEAKWPLLARAASMGHVNAAQAVERERTRLESEMAERQQQDETGRAVMQLFGGFLQSIPRR